MIENVVCKYLRLDKLSKKQFDNIFSLNNSLVGLILGGLSLTLIPT